MRLTFAINLIDLYMNDSFWKRFSVKINMLITPIKVYALLATNINLTLYHGSVFSYSEIHI